MAPKRRRANGEGAVYRRPSDGLWVGMLDLGIVDGRRRRKAVYGQTKREALQKLSTLRVAATSSEMVYEMATSRPVSI